MRSKLAYFSTPSPDFRFSDVENILRGARAYNARTGITSILAMTDSHFLQILEGQREAVSSAFARISADHRHQRVSLFGCIDTETSLNTTEAVEFVGPRVFTKAFCVETIKLPSIVPTLIHFDCIEEMLNRAVEEERERPTPEEQFKQTSGQDFFEISI